MSQHFNLANAFISGNPKAWQKFKHLYPLTRGKMFNTKGMEYTPKNQIWIIDEVTYVEGDNPYILVNFNEYSTNRFVNQWISQGGGWEELMPISTTRYEILE